MDLRPAAGDLVRYRARPNDGDQAGEVGGRWVVCLRPRGSDGRVHGDDAQAGGRARARQANRAGHAWPGAQGVRRAVRAEVLPGAGLVHAGAVQVRLLFRVWLPVMKTCGKVPPSATTATAVAAASVL